MITIRPAHPNDLEPLSETIAQLPLFVRYRAPAHVLLMRWKEALAREDGFLVAEEERQLLGFCWFHKRGTFSSGAYLRTIAVAEPAQGRGVGLMLLEAYEEGAEDPPGGYFLLTSDFNEAAQRFYENNGYRRVGELPAFALADVNEVIFWKPRPR